MFQARFKILIFRNILKKRTIFQIFKFKMKLKKQFNRLLIPKIISFSNTTLKVNHTLILKQLNLRNNNSTLII